MTMGFGARAANLSQAGAATAPAHGADQWRLPPPAYNRSMTKPLDAGATGKPTSGWPPAWAGAAFAWVAPGLAAVLAVAALWQAGTQAAPHGAGLGLSWGLLLACAAAALVAYQVGRLGERLRQQASVHAARMHAAQLAQLFDAVLWRCDEHLCLTDWQPAGSASAKASPAPAQTPVNGRPLAEIVTLKGPGSLAAHLQTRSGMPALEVTLAGQDAATAWQLSALPCHDVNGRFSGFLGSLRVRAAAGAPKPTLHAGLGEGADDLVAPLLALSPAALCVARPGASGLEVQTTNPQACQLLGLPEQAAGMAWATLLECVPAALRDGVRRLRPGQALQHEGWVVQLAALGEPGAPQAGLLLSLLPPPPGSQALAEEQASFSYTVSHDLRAPIRVIEGFTRILKEDYGRVLDRIGNDHLDRVLAAGARMNSMIDALLGLARLSTQPLARQPVNLSQVAGYVVEDLRRLAPQRQVQVHIEPGLSVQGDPTLLRMVLENLLGNAWKYSSKCDAAVISFHRVQRDDTWVYEVRDNGAGFDMRSADRLFGVFQRLHGAHDFPGTGVGLASVRRIVRRHGGQIWADSQPGAGARFQFTLGG